MNLRTLAPVLALVPFFTQLACSASPADDSVATTDAPLSLTSGASVTLDGTHGVLDHTRVWNIGDATNVTRVYFVVHGDGASDYSSSTVDDRASMGKRLPPGEGAIVAYPVSAGYSWPAFTGKDAQLKNGPVLLQMFRQIEKQVGRSDLRFEQFSLSGGGKVNHALLRLVNEHYDDDADVHEFVDAHLRGIHDGDSLCYDILGDDGLRNNYVMAIQRFPNVRFSFIHNTSGQMEYVYTHHRFIASQFTTLAPGDFPWDGGSLSLQDGRLRFWSAPTHWHAWQGQFERVFFGDE
jgi:hypothetical protein